MSEWLQFVSGVNIASPWFLLLLPLLLAAAVVARCRRPPTLLVGTIQPYRESAGATRFLTALRLPLLLEVLGLSLLLVALIRPQFGIEESITRAEGIDIMLALDMSGSMEAVDLPRTDSRRELNRMFQSGVYPPRYVTAKVEVAKFIDGRPNDRIGLIAFGEHAYAVCPPTLDHSFLKQHLSRLEAGMLQDQKTGIAEPVANGTARLQQSKAKRRVLVLVTDGDNNVDAKITPRQAAKLAGEFEITIYTIGIGSDFAFVAHSFFNQMRLSSIPASFDEKLLKDMATMTGGQYFTANDAKSLEQVMKEIDELEKVTFEQPRYIDYRELYQNWLLAGLLLLLAGFAAEHTISLRVP